ncbi:uncharacterized protein LOC100120435 isoform X1 [Nasonia vitripennis]|uniref:Uncharacterized protein n=1 Tax=Nasonia vitripennis TaxID=7425 RepID=A0A7M7G211_NASVI|nr:uncharacterized protein LOC100120435 isoform X1 [Nasonia vitripennis]
MKTLRGKSLLIIGTLLLLSVVELHAAKTLKRVARDAPAPPGKDGEKKNDFDLTTIKNFLDKIPVVGPIVDTVYNYLSELVIYLDKLSNGIIPRALGGSLPCVLTTTKLVCSGTSKDGGTYAIVKKIISMLPSTILPDTLKNGILDFIRKVINPIANALFGGLPK